MKPEKAIATLLEAQAFLEQINIALLPPSNGIEPKSYALIFNATYRSISKRLSTDLKRLNQDLRNGMVLEYPEEMP